MKNIYLILISILVFSCGSQTKTSETKVESTSELIPPFSNQGEQEDYWTQELFKKEYKSEIYSRYNGEIKMDRDNRILFGKVQSIEISGMDSKYNSIFTNGLFYPDLLSSISLNIFNLEELKFLSDSPKVKRFRIWLVHPKVANGQVYVFELQNKNANEKTEWEEWIKEAKLTFVKDGWILL